LCDQATPGQHAGVGDGGAHVVLHQALVERVVFAGREGQHPVVERRALVPQAAHGQAFPPCCSAALSAPTSLASGVPRPSLVDTSVRMLSGASYEITCTRRTPPRMASSMALALGSMPSLMAPLWRSLSRPFRSVNEITERGSATSSRMPGAPVQRMSFSAS